MLPNKLNELQTSKRYDYAAGGYLLLTAASDYGLGAGISPVHNYIGFIVGSGGVTITAITTTTMGVVNTAPGESLADFSFSEGQVIFLKLSQITITAGDILLIKE